MAHYEFGSLYCGAGLIWFGELGPSTLQLRRMALILGHVTVKLGAVLIPLAVPKSGRSIMAFGCRLVTASSLSMHR